MKGIEPSVSSVQITPVSLYFTQSLEQRTVSNLSSVSGSFSRNHISKAACEPGQRTFPPRTKTLERIPDCSHQATILAARLWFQGRDGAIGVGLASSLPAPSSFLVGQGKTP